VGLTLLTVGVPTLFLTRWARGLFVHWFTDYFGPTDAAEPVFFTVLPALVLWFVLLSGAYRFRLLERALGIGRLPEEPALTAGSLSRPAVRAAPRG
jgi:cation-transporting ATPase E